MVTYILVKGIFPFTSHLISVFYDMVSYLCVFPCHYSFFGIRNSARILGTNVSFIFCTPDGLGQSANPLTQGPGGAYVVLVVLQDAGSRGLPLFRGGSVHRVGEPIL